MREKEIKYMVSKFDLMLSGPPAVGALLFVKVVKTVKNRQKLPNHPVLKWKAASEAFE